MNDNHDKIAIGLDLGTTSSGIGVYNNGKVEIIPNGKDEPTTHSTVIIKDSDILIGEDTTDFLVKTFDTCIYEFKRLIGIKFDKELIQKDMETLPFKIIRKDKNIPLIEIKNNGMPVLYNFIEIASIAIKKMIHMAEHYILKKINELVISVPANFNESQRVLTKQAAELAGLRVIRIINEPTAAALAYYYNETLENNKNILVLDFGGGFFEVCIISLKKNEKEADFKEFEVLGISAKLGGKDFDNKLVDYFLNELNKDSIKISNVFKNLKSIVKLLKNV